MNDSLTIEFDVEDGSRRRVTLHGEDADVLAELIKARDAGSDTLEVVALRPRPTVSALRARGLSIAIAVVNDEFFGQIARYTLKTPVSIVGERRGG